MSNQKKIRLFRIAKIKKVKIPIFNPICKVQKLMIRFKAILMNYK